VAYNLSSRHEEAFLGATRVSENQPAQIPFEAAASLPAKEWLRESLLAALRPVVSRANATRVQLHALGHSVTAEAFSIDPKSSGRGLESGGRMLSIAPRLQSLSRPIEHTLLLPYGRGSIGSMVFTFGQASCLCEFEPHSEALAREVALQVARLDFRDRARRTLDIEVILAGTSVALRNLETQIERIGAAPYPVVLEGEFGADPVAIAAAIHLASHREDRPFILLDLACCNPGRFFEEIETAHRAAEGGTLFLGGVDLLDLRQQRDLLRLLRQAKGVLSQRLMVRPIVSTQRSLESLASEGSFCRFLKTELDYLRMRLPPLRDRREDIPVLLKELFHARCSVSSPKRLTEAAATACRRYNWPENESELERTATRLVVMTEESLIGLTELRKTVSWVPDEPGGEEISMPVDTISPDYYTGESTPGVLMESENHYLAPNEALTLEPGLYSGLDPLAIEQGACDVAEAAAEQEMEEAGMLGDLPLRLAAGNFSNLDCMALGIQRALRYVGTNYTEDISLGRLARESYMSPSHLSFLLKRSLGVPFKSLLAAVRIERAKQLLSESNPRSITDISLEVGFGDLSHFERTFKRLVGTNPREYRRQQVTSHAAPIPAIHGRTIHAIERRESSPHFSGDEE
jgi:AraC-like DNA-binding protein